MKKIRIPLPKQRPKVRKSKKVYDRKSEKVRLQKNKKEN